VQTILPMENGSALKLTTARYYTPNGTSIQAEGITPDIAVGRLQVAAADEVSVGTRVKERDLPKHLRGASETIIEPTVTEKDPAAPEIADKEPGTGSLASEDYVLFEALNLLKGLNILRKTPS
jgi:carboxyl-terminal processing protease